MNATQSDERADAMSSPPMPELPSIWCLVANITREPHPEGPDRKMRLGLKHFAPGAKLYCFPRQWGDAGEKLRVLGRHRGGGAKLFEIVIATKWLTDWRVQRVFHPYVVHVMRGHWDDSDAGRERALKMVSFYRRESTGPAGAPGGQSGETGAS